MTGDEMDGLADELAAWPYHNEHGQAAHSAINVLRKLASSLQSPLSSSGAIPFAIEREAERLWVEDVRRASPETNPLIGVLFETRDEKVKAEYRAKAARSLTAPIPSSAAPISYTECDCISGQTRLGRCLRCDYHTPKRVSDSAAPTPEIVADLQRPIDESDRRLLYELSTLYMGKSSHNEQNSPSAEDRHGDKLWVSQRRIAGLLWRLAADLRTEFSAPDSAARERVAEIRKDIASARVFLSEIGKPSEIEGMLLRMLDHCEHLRASPSSGGGTDDADRAKGNYYDGYYDALKRLHPTAGAGECERIADVAAAEYVKHWPCSNPTPGYKWVFVPASSPDALAGDGGTISADDVNAIEQDIGMGFGAWDMVAPEKIIAAVLRRFR